MSSTLVILPNNLGDILMATPVLEGLKAGDQGAKVGFVVEKGFEGPIESNPHCDHIFVFDRKTIRSELWSAAWKDGVSSLRRFVSAVGEERFERIVNFSQLEYLSYLSAVFYGDRRIGRHFCPEGNDAVDDLWSQYLYSIPYARRSNRLHAVDIYRRVAGVNRHHGGYTLALSAQERRDSAALLAGKGIVVGSNPFIVFQPGAAFASKMWPAAHFTRLGTMLADAGHRIVLSGAPAERALCERIAGSIGAGAVSVAGTTSFRGATAMLSHARGCVTGDTALMHASAALSIPTFALFGATNPVETGPYGDGHVIFAGKCADRPCFCESCKNMLCIKSILPETVYGHIVGKPGAGDPKCEIYRTSLAPDGDYSLSATEGGAVSYYDPAASYLSIKACDPDSPVPMPEKGDMIAAIDEAGRFAAVLSAMVADLDAYQAGRKSEHTRAFENRKNDLTAFTTIGAFWASLLNARLNSIPLLDPLKGIGLMRDACADLLARIARAIGSTASKSGG
jgi:ADP-heptose:LPS heptosyltransferase